jgi:hypothetical protein
MTSERPSLNPPLPERSVLIYEQDESLHPFYKTVIGPNIETVCVSSASQCGDVLGSKKPFDFFVITDPGSTPDATVLSGHIQRFLKIKPIGRGVMFLGPIDLDHYKLLTLLLPPDYPVNEPDKQKIAVTMRHVLNLPSLPPGPPIEP